jgi:hypothetical protein
MICELRLKTKGYSKLHNVYSVAADSLIAMKDYFLFTTTNKTPMQVYYKDVEKLQIDEEEIKPDFYSLADKMMTLNPI